MQNTVEMNNIYAVTCFSLQHIDTKAALLLAAIKINVLCRLFNSHPTDLRRKVIFTSGENVSLFFLPLHFFFTLRHFLYVVYDPVQRREKYVLTPQS